MGFCLFNNVAVAAAARARRGLARVAIVDYDVHHGNGTQSAFYDDPAVLFVSSHQYPFYPGTGAADESGRGAGAGCTLNLPLPPGAGDADFDAVYRDAWSCPSLESSAPSCCSSRPDSTPTRDDPLAALRMIAGRYRHLARLLTGRRAPRRRPHRVRDRRRLRPRCPRGLAAAVIDAVSSAGPDLPVAGDRARGRRAVAAARSALTRYWRLDG